MVAEFDIRQEMAEIEATSLTPQQKARSLLRLARRVRDAAQKLAEGAAHLVQDDMPEQAMRLRQAMSRLVDLASEIRAKAVHAMRSPGPQVRFDFPPQPSADWGRG